MRHPPLTARLEKRPAELPGGHFGSLDLSQDRKRDHPLGINREIPGHLSLAEHDDVEYVRGADLILVGRPRQAGGEEGG